ncbi:MAG: S1C family serine protease [Gemmatimonadota bacterium]
MDDNLTPGIARDDDRWHAPGLHAIGDAVRASVVQVRPDGAGGAGVVFDISGRRVVVTNAHVTRGDVGTPILVVTNEGKVMEMRVEAIDARRDLAILAGNPTVTSGESNLPAATPGDLSLARAGQLVVAVGHPFGLANAMTTGVLQSIGPVWGHAELPAGKGALPWLQADIHLAPGNSGGPLCDVQGRVLGINTMVAHGLALAVPIDGVLEFLERYPLKSVEDIRISAVGVRS